MNPVLARRRRAILPMGRFSYFFFLADGLAGGQGRYPRVKVKIIPFPGSLSWPASTNTS